MKSLILAAFLAVSALVTGYAVTNVAEAQGRNCTTRCYGNTCTTHCY